jgi:tetratricopeptide (TPR) repeat protein/alpha-beta hydrolase superfamily lysophospholipase
MRSVRPRRSPPIFNTRLRFLANRRIRRGLIVATVLVLIWLFSSLAVAYRLTRRYGPPTAETVPNIGDWTLESHRLKTSDGEELGAWFAEGKDDGPSVLILHGHKGRRWNSLRRGKLLSSHGCSVLMISHRAHGDSTGDIEDAGYSARRDVCAAVEFLERRRPGRPVIVDGNSLGSAAAIFAASELGHRVAAYILECPYQDLKTAVWNRIDYWLPPGLSHVAYGGLTLVSPIFLPQIDEICPARAIGGVPSDVPVLILAGAADRMARPDEAQALYRQVASHGRLVMVPGAGHGDLLGAAPDLYIETVLAFIAMRDQPENLAGKRVVPRLDSFMLRVNDEPVPGRGKPLFVYRVERVDGSSVWLEPERPGPSWWAKAADVIAVEHAVAFFGEQIHDHPRQPFLHAMRGLLRLDRNDYKAAIADYGEALRLDPVDPSLYCERARARLACQEHEEAIADYSAALRLDSKCTAALIGRGACRLARKESYKAISDLSEAIWLDPLAFTAYVNRGLAWEALGEHRKAIIDYDRALQIRAQDSDTHGHRGRAWAALKNYSRALADYAEAVRLNPDSAGSLDGRAWLWVTCPEAQIRDGKRALESATKACELTGWKDARLLGTLAAANAEVGEFERAVEWQIKANAMATTDEAKAQGAARLTLYRSKRSVRESVGSRQN